MDIMVIKSFLKDKRSLWWILATGIISGIIFTTYLTIHNTNKENEINDAKRNYGNYIYSISGVATCDEDEIIEAANCDYKKAYTMDIEKDGKSFKYYFLDEEYLNSLGCHIVYGEFPKNEDEVLISRWYASYLDISIKEILGSQINLINPNTNKNSKYTISGITDENEKYITVFFNGEKYNIKNQEEILFYPDNLKDIENRTDNFVEKIEEYDWENCNLNYDLLWTYGELESVKADTQRDRLLNIAILIGLIILINIITFNLLAVCLIKWKNSIMLYKKIGASMSQIFINIAWVNAVFFAIGHILGSIISVVGCGLLYKFVAQTSIYVPINIILVVFGVQLVMILGYFWLKFDDYNDMSCSLLENNLSQGNFVRKNYKSILSSKMPVFMLSIRNFIFYGGKKIYNIFTIAVSICGLVILCYQFKEIPRNVDENSDFSYLIEVDDYYSINNRISQEEYDALIKSYEEVQEVCKDNGITTYMTNYSPQDYDIPKKCLSDKFKDSFQNSLSTIMRWDADDNMVKMSLYVMGYTDDVLKEMFGEDFELKDDECIFLGRNLNYDGNGGYQIKNMPGEKIRIRTDIMDDEWFYEKDYTVVKQIDNLPVYPLFENNDLCVILRWDEFKEKLYNNYISSFYIDKISDEKMNEIQHILAGNSHIRILDLEKESLEREFDLNKKRLICMAGIIVFALFTLINVLVQTIIEVKVRTKEFDLMKTLGISSLRQRILIILENSYVYIIGTVLGIAICIIVDRILLNYCIIKESIITASFIGIAIAYGMIMLIIGVLISGYSLSNKGQNS